MVTTVTLPALMTVEAVADYLVRHPNYVRRLLNSGDLVGIRLGNGHWRVKASDLEAFVDSL